MVQCHVFIIDCFVLWAFSSDYAHFIFTHYQAVTKKTKKNFTFQGTKFFYLGKAFYIRGMVAMKHHTKTKQSEKIRINKKHQDRYSKPSI